MDGSHLLLIRSQQFGTQMPQGGHPPHHLITSSARASMAGGISRPMAFAVLRLIVSSNFVGCSIGRSAGRAPCKIRLAYQAPRLNKSDRDVPYDIRPPAFTFSFVWSIPGNRC